MSRSFHRRLPVALVGCAALATSGLLAGCGSGRVAATANLVPAVSGANADVTVKTGQPILDGMISVRDAVVDYDGQAGYQSGATAPLTLRLVNGTHSPVTLVGVTAELSGQAVPVVQSGGAPSPEPTTEAPSPTPTASGRASGRPSTSPAESPSPSPTPVGNSEINIQVPPAPTGLIVLSRSTNGGSYLQLAGLPQELVNGASVRLVFTFRLSDGSTVEIGQTTDPKEQVNAPVAVPTSPLPRTSLTFSAGDGG